MPSLSNIPDELLHPAKLDDFIQWIIDHRLPFNHARTYCRLWSAETRTTIPRNHWARLQAVLPKV